MPGIESPHGTEVSFADVTIGYLTDFDVDAKAGATIDSTNVNSPVIGEGYSSRVIRLYDCTSIEPPTVTVSFWGPPSFAWYDCGMKGQLNFTTQSVSVSGEAILLGITYSGKQNQYTTGSATFQLTGAME